MCSFSFHIHNKTWEIRKKGEHLMIAVENFKPIHVYQDDRIKTDFNKNNSKCIQHLFLRRTLRSTVWLIHNTGCIIQVVRPVTNSFHRCGLVPCICKVPKNTCNMRAASDYTGPCLAFAVPGKNRSFTVVYPTLIFLGRNVATLNLCADDILYIFCYENVICAIFL